MDRRDFIKLTAITGTSATLANCGNPEHQLIRFVPDEDLVPGVAEWKPSICPVCAAGCSVNVRVMEADVETMRNGQAGVVKMGVAKKLEGLPKDPIEQGGLCARGQASIQIDLSPRPHHAADKAQRPARVGPVHAGELGRGDRRADLEARRAGGVGRSRSLRYLTRRRSSRRAAVAAELLSKFGAPAPLTVDLFGDECCGGRTASASATNSCRRSIWRGRGS